MVLSVVLHLSTVIIYSGLRVNAMLSIIIEFISFRSFHPWLIALNAISNTWEDTYIINRCRSRQFLQKGNKVKAQNRFLDSNGIIASIMQRKLFHFIKRITVRIHEQYVLKSYCNVQYICCSSQSRSLLRHTHTIEFRAKNSRAQNNFFWSLNIGVYPPVKRTKIKISYYYYLFCELQS